MAENQNNIFYEKLTTTTASFATAAQKFKMKKARKKLKIAVVGGNVEFSINGTDVAGLVKPGDGVMEFDIEFSQLFVRQASATITELRIWALT